MSGGTVNADVLHVQGDADMQTLRPRGPIVLLNSPGAVGQAVVSQGPGKQPKWGTPSGGGVTWPLAFSGDECFQPNGIANSALCLHNNASAASGVVITGDTNANGPGIDTGTVTALTIGKSNINLLSIGSVSNSFNVNVFRNVIFGPGAGFIGHSSNQLLIAGGATGTPNTSIVFGNVNGGTIARMLNGAPTGQSSSNWVDLTGASSGSAPSVSANGGDATINLNLTPKLGRTVVTSGDLQVNAGMVRLAAVQTAANYGLSDDNGHIVLGVTASSITVVGNFLNVFKNVTGSPPLIRVDANSVDTDVNLGLQPKGAGVVDLHYPAIALGGGATPTLGTIGGSGPATAAQNCWVAIQTNGTTTFLPGWR